MARQKSPVRPVVVQVKLTLIPGLHDKYIAYFAAIPDGQRAATLLRDLDGGMTQRATGDTDAELEDLLTGLL